MAGFAFPRALASAGISGDPIFFEGESDINPGNDVTLFTVTVGAGVEMNLHQILASCNMQGVLKVFINGSKKATRRTAPGKPDMNFSWFPGRPITEGDIVRVDFYALPNQPVVPVEAQLMATEET